MKPQFSHEYATAPSPPSKCLQGGVAVEEYPRRVTTHRALRKVASPDEVRSFRDRIQADGLDIVGWWDEPVSWTERAAGSLAHAAPKALSLARREAIDGKAVKSTAVT